jgi:hypothetical protein
LNAHPRRSPRAGVLKTASVWATPRRQHGKSCLRQVPCALGLAGLWHFARWQLPACVQSRKLVAGGGRSTRRACRFSSTTAPFAPSLSSARVWVCGVRIGACGTLVASSDFRLTWCSAVLSVRSIQYACRRAQGGCHASQREASRTPKQDDQPLNH